MAHAYTPGLRVTPRTRIRKRRILPLPGTVLARKGQEVTAETVVARAELPGDVVILNAVSRLGVAAGELPQYMRKKEGDPVQEGELIAETQPWVRWFASRLESPISGTLESVSSVTGQIILRTPPKPVEVAAYLDGKVVGIVEDEGIEVETTASHVQGIFGIGGEVIGNLRVVVDSPDEELAPERITDELRGLVAVGGSLATGETLRRAVDKGLAGVVVGGFHDRDLRELLGTDLGVAITGAETVGITLIMTEGFGRIPMAERTFSLLKSRDGARASINGATQIRAGVVRPEIIVPWPEDKAQAEAAVSVDGRALDVGAPVRIIRQPWFGRLGKVASLPHEPCRIATEAEVRIAEIELAGGQRATVPRANLEMLEE